MYVTKDNVAARTGMVNANAMLDTVSKDAAQKSAMITYFADRANWIVLIPLSSFFPGHKDL